MRAPPSARAVQLDLARDAIFGHLHVPANAAHATAVLIVPPWGWDAVAAHRSVRAWAQQLAGAGHVTLRFDLPSTGDSGGAPGDPGLLDAWVGAIAATADWLRAESGCDRIAAIGLGLGGLLAGVAAAGPARLDDLVLWAAPLRGRAFVREQQAFSALQDSRPTAGDAPEPPGLPDGWLEAGGFVLAPPTIAALEPLDLRAPAPVRLRRALLLERDGVAVDVAVRTRLQDAGVDVATSPGAGWAAMVAHPEHSAAPEEVFAAVRLWLAQARTDRIRPLLRPAPAPAPAGVVVASHGTRAHESPFVLQTRGRRLSGVLAQPLQPAGGGLCGVFLNAGAVRRIGPNRLWVEAARRWAAAGVPSLRIDLDGIGDSDGDDVRFADVRAFYRRDLVDAVAAVLDELQSRGLGEHFVLSGLCSGGYWAFQTAVQDVRVSAAVLLNAGALEWDDELVTEREARKVTRLHELDSWRRVLRGDVTKARMRAVAGACARSVIVRHRRVTPGIDSQLDRLRQTSTSLVLAFSAGEALHAELAAGGVLARPERWPDIALERLPGHDHTLRPIPAQRAALALLDRHLAAELARAGARAGGGRGFDVVGA